MSFWLVLVLFGRAGEELRFERISERDGLPNNTVMCIEQDKLGFLWISTEGGLARYDGLTFESFQPDPGDPNSIVGNIILGAMVVGGDAWISTRSPWLVMAMLKSTCALKSSS